MSERNEKGQFIKGSQMRDLAGQRFGRLVVLQLSEKKVGRKSYWVCKCDCGTVKDVRSDTLTSKREPRTVSCGCNRNEQAIKNVVKNHSHKGTGTRLYTTWQNIKARCYNVNDDRYDRYGERGIKVYDEWLNDFSAFREWALQNGYEEHLTIERIDIDGNYEPNNCTWIPFEKQANNRRTTIWVNFEGKKISLKELSIITNFNYGTLVRRYKKYGGNIEELIKPLAFKVAPKRSNLTESQVLEIKSLIKKSDMTLTEIANLYHVSKSCISDIKKGKTWSNIN